MFDTNILIVSFVILSVLLISGIIGICVLLQYLQEGNTFKALVAVGWVILMGIAGLGYILLIPGVVVE